MYRVALYMLNRCGWCMYGREMVLNRLTLILVCPCTGHPPIRPMYTVSRSFSYSTPNVFRHISSASRLLVRVTIASASTWARYKLHFWVFLFGTQFRSLPCLVRPSLSHCSFWDLTDVPPVCEDHAISHITSPCLTFAKSNQLLKSGPNFKAVVLSRLWSWSFVNVWSCSQL